MSTPALHVKYAKEMEAAGRFAEALRSYQVAKNKLAVIKLLLYRLHEVDRAIELVREQPFVEGAKLIAAFTLSERDMATSVKFLRLSKNFEGLRPGDELPADGRVPGAARRARPPRAVLEHGRVAPVHAQRPRERRAVQCFLKADMLDEALLNWLEAGTEQHLDDIVAVIRECNDDENMMNLVLDHIDAVGERAQARAAVEADAVPAVPGGGRHRAGDQEGDGHLRAAAAHGQVPERAHDPLRDGDGADAARPGRRGVLQGAAAAAQLPARQGEPQEARLRGARAGAGVVLKYKKKIEGVVRHSYKQQQREQAQAQTDKREMSTSLYCKACKCGESVAKNKGDELMMVLIELKCIKIMTFVHLKMTHVPITAEQIHFQIARMLGKHMFLVPVLGGSMF